MQFKHFGRTGLSVSRLCLGTGTFGHQTGEAEAFRIFDAAADAGVNFIDTADVYPAGALPATTSQPPVDASASPAPLTSTINFLKLP